MGVAEVETGTIQALRQRAGGQEIREVVFAPGRHLGWHFHPHGCLAVVMSGAVRKRFRRLEEDAGHGTVIEMPPAESHEDEFGGDGARLVVLESDADRGPRCFRDWRATVLAHEIGRELERPDAFTPLALEGLALELRAAVARGREATGREPRLAMVVDLLSSDLAAPPSLTVLAGEVGLHPAHLDRLFRAHHGESIGEHGRRIRLEWVAERLAGSDEGIASLAARAGFADQSHLTREFRRRFGVTPGRYRIAHR
jgi:AraC-like DNA-binding protein/quercetin dioxygenase-like cupin family protein